MFREVKDNLTRFIQQIIFKSLKRVKNNFMCFRLLLYSLLIAFSFIICTRRYNLSVCQCVFLILKSNHFAAMV